MRIYAKQRLLYASKEKVDPYKVFDYSNVQCRYPDILDKDQSWYYKKAKQAYAKIILMTFKEYLENCAKARGKGNSTVERRAMTDSNIDSIAQAMLNGEKFRAPQIDFKNGSQEGRHRCAAISRINGSNYKIPVVCIFDYTAKIQQKDLNLPKGWYIKNNYLFDDKNNSQGLITERSEEEFKKSIQSLQ